MRFDERQLPLGNLQPFVGEFDAILRMIPLVQIDRDPATGRGVAYLVSDAAPQLRERAETFVAADFVFVLSELPRQLVDGQREIADLIVSPRQVQGLVIAVRQLANLLLQAMYGLRHRRGHPPGSGAHEHERDEPDQQRPERCLAGCLLPGSFGIEEIKFDHPAADRAAVEFHARREEPFALERTAD